jgi:outer membrane immunogenic protein
MAGVAASVLVQDDYSTISPAGLFGDITLGADFQGSGSNVVFGVFGNYSFGGIDANVGSGYDNITMSIDNQYQLGLRAGYLVTPTTLAYVKAGYSGGTLNVTHTGAGEWSNPSLSGYTAGLGVETRLYGGVFARAEYDYTNYGDNQFHTYSNATTTETSSVNLDEHIAKVGVIYKFGMTGN